MDEYKQSRNRDDQPSIDGYVAALLFPGGAGVAAALFCLTYAWSQMPAWVAPKIYLIQAITQLIK